MFEETLQEFTGLTNEQAYVKIFSERMMKPIPNKVGEFWGTDQRLDMIPFIQNLIETLPVSGQIFDVGAGAGDVVDFALKNAPAGTTINIEEPNPSLIKSYIDRLKKYPNLKVGKVYEKPLQDYYMGKKETITFQQPQRLVLAIHMIYHLTDFTSPHINAEADLIHAISFLYGLLAPKGSLFIVYADLLDNPKGEAVCGIGEKFFRQKYPQERFADNLISIYKARNKLLGTSGSIGSLLSQAYPDTIPMVHSERRESHFFGKTIADIAVLALAAELCPSNSQPFDIGKLKFCLDYVSRYPERLGLCIEESNIYQKGLWRANEPQVLTTITKKMAKA